MQVNPITLAQQNTAAPADCKKEKPAGDAAVAAPFGNAWNQPAVDTVSLSNRLDTTPATADFSLEAPAFQGVPTEGAGGERGTLAENGLIPAQQADPISDFLNYVSGHLFTRQ